ncbi:hypothetical protein SAMD00019534_030040 [Acytostelium subglobosum LB1]|uniref:hypothetical protein n=1 Tax=Acytostelium subglobosum LB1 TaxID=1410327 RepID=UPI000644A5C4|nr:hypothetical protein SAMD00019534_030040 [Acytostelium subglobosum LB1]GAM19829.1 hypothetical protein SAMD00019534_030040 [Acytostelium subglobosum LB1]|eukprot:XP_012756591.1 hypothetical protein SAMD00019534_030040 [Acytostelium subglobosum LB1]
MRGMKLVIHLRHIQPPHVDPSTQIEQHIIQLVEPSQTAYFTLSVVGRAKDNTMHRSLPWSITTLGLGPGFHQPITPGIFGDAPSFTKLDCGLGFNNVIAPHSLPTTLISLKLRDMFNTSLAPGSLPNSLEKLSFGYCYNKPFEPGCLPWSLKSLKLGHMFNCPLHPASLPRELQFLSFGFYFNQPIQPDTLPQSLLHLKFVGMFNQPIDDRLPISIKSLAFGPNFLQPLTLRRQTSITSLEFTSMVYCPIKMEDLPPTVHTLLLHPLDVEMIPSTLTSLTLYDYFDGMFDQYLGQSLPSSSLTSLTFGKAFKQIIVPGLLPSTLKRLVFGSSFNHSLLPNSLPDSITELRLGANYTKPLSLDNLPSSLLKLWIPTMGILNLNNIPQSLKHIMLVIIYNADHRPHSRCLEFKADQSILIPSNNLRLDSLSISITMADEINDDRTRILVIKQLLSDYYPNVTNICVHFVTSTDEHHSNSITKLITTRRITPVHSWFILYDHGVHTNDNRCKLYSPTDHVSDQHQSFMWITAVAIMIPVALYIGRLLWRHK